MKLKLNIGTKITLLVTGLVLACIMVFGYLTLRQHQNELVKAHARSVKRITEGSVKIMDQRINDYYQAIAKIIIKDDEFDWAFTDSILQRDLPITLLRKDEYSLKVVDENSLESHIPNNALTIRDNMHFVRSAEDKVSAFIKEAYSVKGKELYLLLESDLTEFVEQLENNADLKTEELDLLVRSDDNYTYVTGTDGDFRLNKIIQKSEPLGAMLEEFYLKDQGYERIKEEGSPEQLYVWSTTGGFPGLILFKQPVKSILKETYKLVYFYAVAAGILLVLVAVAAMVLGRQLTQPVHNLRENIDLLSKGILPDRIERSSKDELGDISESVNKLTKGLKRTSSFSEAIGKGKYDTEFTPLSEDDSLGNNLLQMRDSIQQAEQREKERSWIVTGMAELGSILRMIDNLSEIGDNILSYICERIDAIQGALYVLNEDEGSGERPYLEMNAAYAYNMKKYMEAKFQIGEGLVGQCAFEKDTIVRTEIPEDYVTVTSGILGDRKPSALLFVPLIANEKMIGVLELASFDPFTEREVNFIEETSEIIARTIYNITVNERTRRLLAESQQMSSELQEQQEQLRQNAEEMQATQEELRKTNSQLEDQITAVNNAQKRMQMILENASEVILILEENAEVRYVSPAVDSILGYSQEDFSGKSFYDNFDQQSQEHLQNMIANLLEDKETSQTVQLQFKKQDGTDIWIETMGNNHLNDPAIQGILINTRDITERHRAEQEQKMRGQMQALSENSVDLITRFNTDGDLFYINPVIEDYIGEKPENLLNKNLKEMPFENGLADNLFEILKTVQNQGSKFNTELDFHSSKIGDRVMYVNAIPEYDENELLNSVLVVSHDITNQKAIEQEIRKKNKNISDSINYAYRIQSAILPNYQTIESVFRDSFILYKPRDVVSGDFPWYLEYEGYQYIAAVDCTGHGVPGALLSLIGYFLLNEVIKSKGIVDPGRILDELDRGVSSTLKQDAEDAKMKDGMDIALCRVDVENRKVAYAGAHRPLWVVRDGELEEIKGDKWPIGGGVYKNQTEFANSEVELNAGDAVYFSSDGYPDQFGGPKNRKFGTKRTKTILSENHALPIQDVMKQLDEKWEEWKGEYKQTDDMLLIGIRF